jgi:hypothetical protein
VWFERDAARGRVVLSPPHSGKIKAEVDGDRLRIRAPADGGFRPNTAYRLTVLGSLKDLHGVSMGRPFSLAFTTGAGFDSGAAQGRILAGDRLGIPLAALYRAEAREGSVFPRFAAAEGFAPDSLPHPGRELPAWLAPADSLGAFSWDSVAQGEYALLAFADLNGNAAPDPGLEPMGVGPRNLPLKPRGPPQTLRLAPVDTTAMKLRSARFVGDTVLEAGILGALRVQFDRNPHPAAAADIRNYRITPLDAKDTNALQAAGWDPVAKEWVLQALLPAPGTYALQIRGVTDRSGIPADTASRAEFAVPSAVSDSGAWNLAFLKTPDASGLTALETATGDGLPPAREFRLRSSRLLSPNRWRALEERLEVRVDTLPAKVSLRRLGPGELSLRLENPPRPGTALKLRLLPAPPDTVPRPMAAARIADSSRLAGVRFRVPDPWKGWTFLLQGTFPATESAAVPLGADSAFLDPVVAGKYRVAAFLDRDRDGVWHPGALRPWTPQEPYAVLLDSVEVAGGGLRDLTSELETAARKR